MLHWDADPARLGEGAPLATETTLFPSFPVSQQREANRDGSVKLKISREPRSLHFSIQDPKHPLAVANANLHGTRKHHSTTVSIDHGHGESLRAEKLIRTER